MYNILNTKSKSLGFPHPPWDHVVTSEWLWSQSFLTPWGHSGYRNSYSDSLIHLLIRSCSCIHLHTMTSNTLRSPHPSARPSPTSHLGGFGGGFYGLLIPALGLKHEHHASETPKPETSKPTPEVPLAPALAAPRCRHTCVQSTHVCV